MRLNLRLTLNWILPGLLAASLCVGCDDGESPAAEPVVPLDQGPGGQGGAGGQGGEGGEGGVGGGEDPVRLDRIEVIPERAAIKLDDAVRFQAVAHYTDGRSEPLTRPTFTVDDERVFAIEGDLLTAVAGGPVTVSTTHEGLTGSWSGTVKCGAYPFYTDVLRFGSNAPPLNWPDAYRADGSRTHFSLDDFRCFAEYADKDTLLVVMTAGWCPACTQWKQILQKWLPQLEGMEILYVVSQDANGANRTTADYAQQHVSRIIGDDHGIRVGGLGTFIENSAMDNFIHTQDFIAFYPTNWIVRKRDMRVITDSLQARGQLLPLSDIARDPEANYRSPRSPSFNADCGPEDEEPTDAQNDNFAEAPVLPPGTHNGALCNANMDYYAIAIPGAWRVTLRFSHVAGDLNLYVYQPRADGRGYEPAPAGRGGLLGSDTMNDEEIIEHRGPATIGISGFLGAQGGRYTVQVEAL